MQPQLNTLLLMAGNDKSGKAKAGDKPKCANNGCTKPGVHLCARCRGVMYCSAACQKVHWKQKGGHKQACTPVATAALSSVAAAAAAAAAMGAGGGDESEAGACIICLCDDPSPIQSGCACRSDAGLAHVECRAEDAAHRMKISNREDGWWKCGTCGRNFTGAMQPGLAVALCSASQRLPKENKQRLAADMNLANALSAHGKLTEAEATCREVLPVQQRVLGPEHPDEHDPSSKSNPAPRCCDVLNGRLPHKSSPADHPSRRDAATVATTKPDIGLGTAPPLASDLHPPRR
jgi:hypothetical protein